MYVCYGELGRCRSSPRSILAAAANTLPFPAIGLREFDISLDTDADIGRACPRRPAGPLSLSPPAKFEFPATVPDRFRART